MKNRKNTNNNPNIAKRGHKALSITLKVIFSLIVILIAVYIILHYVNLHKDNKITLNNISEKWNEYDYISVYEMGKQYLQEDPFNNTALTYYAYACFYLSVSQTDTSLAQDYLDESINNLRLALYEAEESLVPQLQYMLGKAYFYKNTISSYYYADLAVKYLSLAKQNGYITDDISEYLGLSYAALGMTMESISAFTDSLLVRESDYLLLSIAEQYYKAQEYSASEQYLFRIINNSDNDELKIKSKLLLGNIYIDKKDFDNALKEFNEIIDNYENSADAHFGIGLVYEKQNNLVKARAEWRKTLKIQGNHAGAIKKFSEY